MKTLLKLSFIIVLAMGLTHCKKNQTGGKASVSGTVAHHGKVISGAFVYIKFNAVDFPGDDYKLYDTYVKADVNGYYKFPVYKGNYYLYATGYDNAIPYPYVVKGGLSFSIRNKENLTKDIAVTE